MANPKVFDFKAFDFKARHFKAACLAMRLEIKEIGVVEHGDDAAHCSNGLTAQKFRDATGEERAIYRRRMRGTIALCGALLLIAGGLVMMNHLSGGLTQLSSLSAHRAAASRGAN
jgi:hypothetical protein